jgi:CRISPR-associated protein Cst2
MSMHLFGAVVTPHAVAANNRGENEGNMTTLQKLLWNGDVHSTVSAEAIRWAMRADWQARGLGVNRKWDETARRHEWQDRDFASGGAPYIDDDVLGYMSAQAAREEADADADGDAPRAGGRSRARGTALVRRSRFETTRAISVGAWSGDTVFNVAGVNATPSASRTGTTPVPYSGEVHATRYQYSFALTPEDLLDRTRAAAVVDAIVDLRQVAGSHARYHYDFAPDTVIFRWTSDPAPRILYPFRLDEERDEIRIPELLRRVRAGDIEAEELIVGGALAELPDGAELARLGAAVHPGVKAAARDVKERLARHLGA